MKFVYHCLRLSSGLAKFVYNAALFEGVIHNTLKKCSMVL